MAMSGVSLSDQWANDYSLDIALKEFEETSQCKPIYLMENFELLEASEPEDYAIRIHLFKIVNYILKIGCANITDLEITSLLKNDFSSIIKSLELLSPPYLKSYIKEYFKRTSSHLQRAYLMIKSKKHDSSSFRDTNKTLLHATTDLLKYYRSEIQPPFLATIHQKYQAHYQDSVSDHGLKNNLPSTSKEAIPTNKNNLKDSPKIDSNLDIGKTSDSTVNVPRATLVHSVSPALSELQKSGHQLLERNNVSCNDQCSSDDDLPTILPGNAKQTPYPAQSQQSMGPSSDFENNNTQVENLPAVISDMEEQVEKPPSVGLLLSIPKQALNKKKNYFDLESDARLIRGVFIHGVGHWKKILKLYKFPAYRNSVHLKDRWRTLLERNHVVMKDGGGGISIESTLHQTAYNDLVKSLNYKKQKYMERNQTKPNDKVTCPKKNEGKTCKRVSSLQEQPKKVPECKNNAAKLFRRDVHPTSSCHKSTRNNINSDTACANDSSHMPKSPSMNAHKSVSRSSKHEVVPSEVGSDTGLNTSYNGRLPQSNSSKDFRRKKEVYNRPKTTTDESSSGSIHNISPASSNETKEKHRRHLKHQVPRRTRYVSSESEDDSSLSYDGHYNANAPKYNQHTILPRKESSSNRKYIYYVSSNDDSDCSVMPTERRTMKKLKPRPFQSRYSQRRDKMVFWSSSDDDDSVDESQNSYQNFYKNKKETVRNKNYMQISTSKKCVMRDYSTSHKSYFPKASHKNNSSIKNYYKVSSPKVPRVSSHKPIKKRPVSVTEPKHAIEALHANASPNSSYRRNATINKHQRNAVNSPRVKKSNYSLSDWVRGTDESKGNDSSDSTDFSGGDYNADGEFNNGSKKQSPAYVIKKLPGTMKSRNEFSKECNSGTTSRLPSNETQENDTNSTTSSPNKRRKRKLFDVEGEQLQWDSAGESKSNSGFTTKSSSKTIGASRHGLTPKSLSSKTIGASRHKKKPWTLSEVNNLKKGINEIGIGNWSTILQQFKFNNRTSMNLKDKYRTMKKQGLID